MKNAVVVTWQWRRLWENMQDGNACKNYQNYRSYGLTMSSLAPCGDVEEQKMTDSAQVGIIAWANNAPGFSAVLKERCTELFACKLKYFT